MIFEKFFLAKKNNVNNSIPSQPKPTLLFKDLLPDFDKMDGLEFEKFCATILKANGFYNVENTKSSGDQGIDIIALKDDIKYGIQCKCYYQDVGNHAIQEAYSGKEFYDCHIAVVLTNRVFTPSAKELARKNHVILWGRDKLIELSKIAFPKDHYISTSIEESFCRKNNKDILFFCAGQYIIDNNNVSIGALMRKFKINFVRAENIISQLYEEGIVSDILNNGERSVCMTKEEFDNYKKTKLIL